MNTINTLVLAMYFESEMNDNSDKVKHINVVCGQIYTYFYVFPTIFSALFGYIIAKFGYMRKIMLLSYILFISALIMLLAYPIEINIYWIILPFVILGFSYAMYSPVIWSIIKYEVDEKCIGTAFGIVWSMYSATYILFLYLYGLIVDTFKGTRKGYFYA